MAKPVIINNSVITHRSRFPSFPCIQEGIIVINKALRIQYINTAAQVLLGIQEDAGNRHIGRYLREVEWGSLLDEDPDEWHRVSRQEIEVFYPRHRFLNFYLVPIRIDPEKQEFPLATVILHDVTEAHRDTRKTIESQKVQAITMLAAGVAHELGNPLNSLNIHLQLLRRQLARLAVEDARQAEELLDVSVSELKRLDAIVRNFLQAIRPVAPQPVRSSMTEILTESLAFMGMEIEGRGILVEASWPDDLPTVMADADQLKQAFYNIIRNAIQAMPDGGVLRIVCDAGGDFLNIRFADTGKGISAEEMTQIMEPYFSTKPDGTGLGLLIVDRIVRAHGGELGIESADSGGAVFTVRLPLRERQVRLLNAPRSGEASAAGAVDADDSGSRAG